MRLVSLASIVLITAASSVFAAPLTTWSATPSFTDPNDLAITPGQDILSGWYSSDAQYHYFRIDLESAPASANYAGLYGIYIDSVASAGAEGSDWDYVPSALSGVDYILDMHFDPFADGWFQTDFHIWTPDGGLPGGGSWSLGTVDAHANSENGGTSLEWQIDKSKIAGSADFTIRAASHDQGSSAPTYDYAPNIGQDGFQIPEPASSMILLAGSAMLMIRRRRA